MVPGAQAAFIDNPAPIGYEAHLRRVGIDTLHGKEPDPRRGRGWPLRQSVSRRVLERRTAEVEAEAEQRRVDNSQRGRP